MHGIRCGAWIERRRRWKIRIRLRTVRWYWGSRLTEESRNILGHVVGHKFEMASGMILVFWNSRVEIIKASTPWTKMNSAPIQRVYNRYGSPNIRSKGRPAVVTAPYPRSSKYFHVCGDFICLLGTKLLASFSRYPSKTFPPSTESKTYMTNL